jgi:hypothetical protein
MVKIAVGMVHTAMMNMIVPYHYLRRSGRPVAKVNAVVCSSGDLIAADEYIFGCRITA